jgi:mono/diheme cytochrome c family protein
MGIRFMANRASNRFARVGSVLFLILAASLAPDLSPLRADEGSPAPQSAGKTEEKRGAVSLDVGKAVYVKRCLGCHGANGAGDGPAADRFKPRPRDFTLGLFKYKTTPHGSPPTDEDLVNVVTKGLPGTGMPAWESLLKENEIRSVVQVVKSFSDKFSGTPPTPITIGPEVKSSKESVEKGKQIFREVGCFMCHGNEARGDGVLAPTLKDATGRPVQPRNLTKGWTFRSGNAPKDV